MKSRSRKKEVAKENNEDSFFGRKKNQRTSASGSGFFNTTPGVQRKPLTNTKQHLIQKEPDEKDAGTTKDAGTAKTAPAGGFSISTIRNEFVSTIFAEAWPGQETDIAWIYYNLISKAKAVSGLNKSAAFTGKSDNFKIAMTALGDKRYGADAPKDKWMKETKATSIQDYVDNNGYFKSVASPRITSIAGIVDGIINDPSTNPYPGWTGQGNLNDFNNISSPGSTYWKMARAYYWLQEAGTVKDTYVKAIGSGKSIQFIFNGEKIEAYFKANPLDPKAVVPIYEIKP